MHSSQLVKLVNQSGNLSVSQLGPEVTLWKLKKILNGKESVTP